MNHLEKEIIALRKQIERRKQKLYDEDDDNALATDVGNIKHALRRLRIKQRKIRRAIAIRYDRERENDYHHQKIEASDPSDMGKLCLFYANQIQSLQQREQQMMKMMDAWNNARKYESESDESGNLQWQSTTENPECGIRIEKVGQLTIFNRDDELMPRSKANIEKSAENAISDSLKEQTNVYANHIKDVVSDSLKQEETAIVEQMYSMNVKCDENIQTMSEWNAKYGQVLDETGQVQSIDGHLQKFAADQDIYGLDNQEVKAALDLKPILESYQEEIVEMSKESNEMNEMILSTQNNVQTIGEWNAKYGNLLSKIQKRQNIPQKVSNVEPIISNELMQISKITKNELNLSLKKKSAESISDSVTIIGRNRAYRQMKIMANKHYINVGSERFAYNDIYKVMLCEDSAKKWILQTKYGMVNVLSSSPKMRNRLASFIKSKCSFS